MVSSVLRIVNFFLIKIKTTTEIVFTEANYLGSSDVDVTREGGGIDTCLPP